MGPKMDHFGAQNGIRNRCPFWERFWGPSGAFWDHFGIHFGPILGSVRGCFPDRFFGRRPGASGILGWRFRGGSGEDQGHGSAADQGSGTGLSTDRAPRIGADGSGSGSGHGSARIGRVLLSS